MKNIKFVVTALFFVLSLTFISCSDDDEKTGGSFKYDNKTYELGQGELYYYGEDEPGVHIHNVILFSSGVTVDEDGEPTSGIGDYIAFELYSSSATQLDETTYMSAGVSSVGS